MPKFFNKPQLGQANLTQAQRTNETGVDNTANAQAQQANRSVDHLLNLGGSAMKIVGKYQANLEAKGRLQSQKEMPFYTQMMQEELNKTENFESLGRDALNSKFDEVTDSFMKRYKDSPFNSQLRNDIEGMRTQVLTQMISKRDGLHAQQVSDATAEAANSLGEQFANGTLGEDSLRVLLDGLTSDSTLAHQVPSSTELDLPEGVREQYKTLTKQQARDSILKGLMMQTGKPENSKVATLLADKDFRQLMEIGDTDEDYNKLVANAFKRGEAADKLNYSTGLNSLKEGLYDVTNQGMNVNIDREVANYRKSGKELTAKDEHKLRKEFAVEHKLILSSDNYIKSMEEGRDPTAGMTRKQREDVYNRSFTDVLNITGENTIGISDINGALSQPLEQSQFLSYIKSGAKIPDKVKQMFDVPAGSSVQKWNEANLAIMSMEAASIGSGYSVEEIIGVKQVSKIRGLARLLNDEQMDEGTKQNAIEALQSRSASFNSKGYLRGDDSTKVDTDWLQSVSKDASWTNDDYVSNAQNADEISGNYQAYKLAGHSDQKAQELALDLFESSNRSFEMPNGGEIAIPREHKYLNNESIVAFSKDAARFPSLKLQRDANVASAVFGDNWYTQWDTNNEISIQKSYNFSKSGKYDMLYKGSVVKNSSFTYGEMEEFISNQDHKTRSKITGVKVERPFKDVEREALEKRSKRVKKGKTPAEVRLQGIFDLTI